MRRFVLLAAVVGLISCGSQEQQKQEEEKKEEAVENKVSYTSYGDKITADGALQAKELSVKIQDKDTLEVKLEAVINETCAKKGCWMTVDMGGEEEMMVRFKDYGFFVPKEGQQGKTAIFSGKAFRDTITVDMLQHYAEDAGKSQEEIDAITEPEITMSFVADGVIIKE